MGRKIDMKKIEDVTKCQVTFSKRRSSLMKKANEISVCCDVDVAFVAFSPSGRVSKFSNQKRIEDVLNRYVDLPADRRLTHIEKVEEKVEKLKQLSHIKGDTSKLHFLDKQIENLELQIKKCGLELQILEADLRDYEVAPEQEPASLHQLSWCERNLNHSLEKVKARKNAIALMAPLPQQPIQMETENQGRILFSSNLTENEPAAMGQNPAIGDILMKLDPWSNPYSAKVRDLFQDLLDQANITTPNMDSGPSNIYNFPVPESSNTFELAVGSTSNPQMPFMKPSVVDAFPKLPDQISIDAWDNFSPATFSDAVHMSTQFQAPRYGSATPVATNAYIAGMPQTRYNDIMGSYLQFTNSNCNQFNNFTAEEIIGQPAMNFANNLSNTNAGNATADFEGSFSINCSQIQRNDQVQASPYQLQPDNNLYPDTLFGNFPSQDALGQNVPAPSAVQRTSSWNWEDLLEENCNFPDNSKK